MDFTQLFRIRFIIYILSDAITQIQTPIAMSGLTSSPKKAKKQMSEFLNEYFCLIMIFYVLLCLFSYEVVTVMMDEKFADAWKLVYFLAFIFVLGGIYRIFTNIIAFHEKNWIISVSAILQALVNIILNLLFIPIWGMYLLQFQVCFQWPCIQYSYYTGLKNR